MSQQTLDSLSLDVSYSILSYLYQGPHSHEHPYIVLSAVSKSLNGLVEGYTSHILATRLAKWAVSKSGIIPPQRPTSRQQLLRHVWKHCDFCNQRSSRRAILADSIICCKNCDKNEWGEKITMTDACKKYYLKQPDLFNSNIRFGQYFVFSGLTTLFLESEVRKLATRIHGGDLADFLTRRTTQSQERKTEREKQREAKKAYLSRVLVANGLTDPEFVTSLSPFLYAGENKRPAMSVLEVVRKKLLEQRLERENEDIELYNRNIHDSRDKKLFDLFCQEFNLFPESQKEAMKEEYKSEEEIDIKVEKDRETRLRRYEFYRSMWARSSSAPVKPSKGALWMQKQSIIAPSRRDPWETMISTQGEPPWSWASYPILIKDVMPEDPEQVTKSPMESEDSKKAIEKEKELRRVNKWNAGAEKEMARITALINDRGLDKDLWCKVKGPTQYSEVGRAG